MRGTLEADRVVRSGYGARRSTRCARRLARTEFASLAIAGLAGGVDPSLRSGEIIVARELYTASDAVPPMRTTAPEMLASEMRACGLSVHLGAVVTTDHVVHGGERAELARTGALAVDMETTTLAPAVGDRPLAVVRVVFDAYRQPLLGPGSPRRLIRALRRLRETGRPLARWAARIRSTGDDHPRGERFGNGHPDSAGDPHRRLPGQAENSTQEEIRADT